MLGPTHNLGPIHSAVLINVGYKQTDSTDRQPDKQSIYIDIQEALKLNAALKIKTIF